jgi:site-specific DNA-adenine methylase
MTEQDHVDLADLLLSVQGKWLLTYGNHPLIRKLYRNRGFVVQTIRSSMASRKWGQGLREGALVNLVIRNYRLRQRVGK